MKRSVENHLTLRERILGTIRDAIMNGSLKPGEKIAEPELAARFGISRTPIREAFRQLESEGYLTVIPRKGALVASFSAKDVEEFYAIKSILEGYAARKACERLTPKDIAKLEKINEKLRALAEEGDVGHFFKVHNTFHEVFIKGAGNEKLAEMIFALVKKFQRLRLASLAKPGRMQVSVEEHEKIIDAFRSRNPHLAEALVQKNAEYGGRVLIEEEKGAPPASVPADLDL
ncbi:GntR family transcriptional regulator [Geomonas sp. RF6]|uniref:GntR family transcriptional regulator n=1 Tax=Geomonas sp. RF6 TaxID=2897342 RepID=UPI001E45A608|nr:GntR family transcriptional regulator [Geomonas sp. RF6]UFS72369.1 GntR family transcriptional regulator [Geomonas sp. RF6]